MVTEERKDGGIKGPLQGTGDPTATRWDEDWLIIISQGRTMIGKQAPLLGAPNRISPIFELQPQAQATPRGELQISHLILPLLLLASIRSIDLPQGAIVIPVTGLSNNERKGLRLAISNCEQMVESARLAESGIAIAKSLPPNMRRPG